MLSERLKDENLAQPVAIIGAGVTGKSYFDLLQPAGITCRVFDEGGKVPPTFAEHADAVQLGAFNDDSFAAYGTILLSPGVDTRRHCFAKYEDRLLTDIELFARLAKKPVIGVTGSNGKSTVVTLIYDVTVAAGKHYALCGNIGLPVLQALKMEAACDGYIIELSSYHLERAPSLKPIIGVWLNVSPDHLDRYDSYDDYVAAKANLLAQSAHIVANADDAQVYAYAENYRQKTLFSQLLPSMAWYAQNGVIYHHNKPVFNMRDFSQLGNHHADNLMAVFAVAEHLGIRLADTVAACRAFKPLASRSVLVAEHHGIVFVNDSKGTNIGATAAAISGMTRPVILLAGGQGKGQDFHQLASAAAGRVRAAILFGQDADMIKNALAETLPCYVQADLPAAVAAAVRMAQRGDVVMFSPACASFDQYAGYLQRGEHFTTLVKEWIDANP